MIYLLISLRNLIHISERLSLFYKPDIFLGVISIVWVRHLTFMVMIFLKCLYVWGFGGNLWTLKFLFVHLWIQFLFLKSSLFMWRRLELTVSSSSLGVELSELFGLLRLPLLPSSPAWGTEFCPLGFPQPALWQLFSPLPYIHSTDNLVTYWFWSCFVGSLPSYFPMLL